MTPLRFLLGLGVAILILATFKAAQWPLFLAGWWACCAWLLITRQWRPFA